MAPKSGKKSGPPGKKPVIKAIVKEKAKSKPSPPTPTPVKEAKAKAREETKPQEKKAAAKETAKVPRKGKGKGKAKGKQPAKAVVQKESAKATRKTKARRLEEAQAEQDREEGDDEAPAGAAQRPPFPASDEPRGVIYIGHIPSGFFEPQMKQFFGQFGKVTRLRISRSKRNAASKGYGWVEFEEEAVAKIVQQTMNGYLLFGKKLKVDLVNRETQHPALFKGCRRRMRNFSGLRRKKAREAYNNRPKAEVDGEVVPRPTLRQEKRRAISERRLRAVLKRMEVDFDPSLLEGATAEASASDAEGKPAAQQKRKAEGAAPAQAAGRKKRKQAS